MSGDDFSQKKKQKKTSKVLRYGLVLNGGGVKGAAFGGALLEFDNRVEVKFSSFCGTSAGAILAASLAMGYGSETIARILEGQRFSDFLSKKWDPSWSIPPWQCDWLPKSDEKLWLKFIRAIVSLFREPLIWVVAFLPFLRGARYSSAPIGKFIQYLEQWRPHNDGRLRDVRNSLLGDSFKSLPNELMIVASSSGQSSTHVFNKPDDKIEFAVRCSMAIPGFFESQRLGRDVIYDGGLVANFAYDKFAEIYSDTRPIGMYLHDGADINRESDLPQNIFSVIRHLFRIYQGQDETTIIQENKASIVTIDTSPIGTIDFNLSELDMEFLSESGRVAVMRYLIEEDHDLPLRKDGKPSQSDYEKANNDLRVLREAALKRWHWPHRIRRLRMVAGLFFGLILVISPLLFVAVYIGLSFGIETNSRPVSLEKVREVLDIAIIRNGNAEHVKTNSIVFQEELNSVLRGTGYVPHFEEIVGYPAVSDTEKNKIALKNLINGFIGGPDYLVTVGTQVSVVAKEMYLGRIPLVFVGITDPVMSGLVSTYGDRSDRENISGIAYAPPTAGMPFLFKAFPKAEIGFVFSEKIPQDVIARNLVEDGAAKLGRNITMINSDNLGEAEKIDLLFGWYYFNENFSLIKSKTKKPLIAGNQKDMVRGGIAMIANNDREAGMRAAHEIVARAVLDNLPLWRFKVRRTEERIYSINKKIARQYGILLGTLSESVHEIK